MRFIEIPAKLFILLPQKAIKTLKRNIDKIK